jgi:2-polyprenyl-3-methyl-5-hydroxy-6-metoxy-1,4-benzoquinol methylase
MALVPALDRRHLTPELMDDPSLDERRHRSALRALARFNRLSRADSIVWGPIRDLALMPGHPVLRVLDIATGSGDIPIALGRRARAVGIPITIDGCDIGGVPLAEAQRRAAAAGHDGRFFRLEVLRDALPADYDVVMCSLFTHHLANDQVVELLYHMRCAARRMVMVSDLRRCRAGYLLAGACSRAFTSSDVARTDALKSVRAAFTVDEFAAVTAEAGLEGARIEPVWPCRFRLVWSRP